MAGGMVGMRRGTDEETHRQGSELLPRLQDRARVRRAVPAVDEQDPFAGEDDAAVGIEILADVDVDPVFQLPDLRAEILGECEAGGEERDEDRECVLEFNRYLKLSYCAR